MAPQAKLKLALYWAASCGGCEIAMVELREKLLVVDQVADILFWPVAVDAKYKDVEAMPDKHIDVCLFNGAIRTSENEHLAHLMRKKSKVLVAFGSCAHEGLHPGPGQPVRPRSPSSIMSTGNPHRSTIREQVFPRPPIPMPEGEIQIPKFYNTVKTLGQTVDVDYFLPGCPPQPHQIWAVIEAILGGKLPPKGSVVGANEKTVCEECKHTRQEKRIKKFYRIHEMIPDSTKCLFDQGIICAGPATRGRLRVPLHQSGYALPRLLRTAAARGGSGGGPPFRRGFGGGCRHGGRSGADRGGDPGSGGHVLPLRSAVVAAPSLPAEEKDRIGQRARAWDKRNCQGPMKRC